jgi:hypothetical protein
MAASRLPMRKLRDVLRLKYDSQLPLRDAYSQFVSAIASGRVGSSRRCVRCIVPARSCLSISPASGHT